MRTSTRPRLRLFSVVAAIAAAATMSACGSSAVGGGGAYPALSGAPTGAAGAALDPNGSLAKAARKEGSVTWYAPTLGNIDAIAAVFTKAYGIKVNLVELANVQLQARFSSEAQSGKVGADVVSTGYSSFFSQALDKGWLTPLSKSIPDFPGTYPSKYVLDDGGTAINMVAATGIAYDTDKVKGADIPTDWAQLADPKWKGKIISVDPNASLGYLTFWDAMLTKYGSDTVSKIGKNITRSFATATSEMQSLTAGEGQIVLYTTAGLTSPTVAKGAPVAFKEFDFTTGVDFAVGTPAKAPHPNAAKLFATWMLSKPGEATFSKLGESSSPLVPGTLPSQYVQPALTVSDARKAEIDNALGVTANSN